MSTLDPTTSKGENSDHGESEPTPSEEQDPSEVDNERLEELVEAWATDIDLADDGASSTISKINDSDLPIEGDDEIPPRFLDGCLGDEKEARRRWELTKRWRHDKEIDFILDRPQKYFTLIKKHYPHSLHELTKQGHYLYLERPGHANFPEIFRHGVTLDDIAAHYVFITEHLWRYTDPRDDGKLYTILDLKGCKMGALAGDILRLFRKCTGIMQAHYPERSFKVAVVNVPWWFSSAFKTVSPLIDPRTKKKIAVFGKRFLDELLLDIASSNLPKCLGGTSETPVGESTAERALWHFVEELNARHGLVIDPELEPLDKLSKAEQKARRHEEKKAARIAAKDEEKKRKSEKKTSKKEKD